MTAEPHYEVTYSVRVKARVRARLEGVITVTRADVAKWGEMDEEEVTDAHVLDYVTEDDDAWEESDLDLEEVDDWDKITAELTRTRKVRVTPPGMVPLWEETHGHDSRESRDACQRGRCYLDTIVVTG